MADVPNVAGVPALLSYASTALGSTASLLTADLLGNYLDVSGPWGIYDSSGNLVISPDTFGGIEFSREYSAATAPQEQGSFLNYNKVQAPFSISIQMFCGGENADRAAFFAALDAASVSIALYSVVTPEIAYANCNVLGYRYLRRQDRGAWLIGADVKITEIRQSATQQFTQSTTAQPDGASTTTTGSVQATTPTATQDAAIEQGGLY